MEIVSCVFKGIFVLCCVCDLQKKKVRKAPFFGWAAQHIGIFLSRRGDDLEKLAFFTKIWTQYVCQSFILFYPEGTVLWEQSIAASNRFADKQGLPRYKYG